MPQPRSALCNALPLPCEAMPQPRGSLLRPASAAPNTVMRCATVAMLCRATRCQCSTWQYNAAAVHPYPGRRRCSAQHRDA